MQYKKRTLVVSRSRVSEAEGRVAVQRQVVEQLKNAGHPTDDADALLLLMEQSLRSMKRFLAMLERDVDVSAGLDKTLRKKSPAIAPRRRKPS